jgi:hypothetical protein
MPQRHRQTRPQRGMDADRDDGGLPLGVGLGGCRTRKNFLRERQRSYKVAAQWVRARAQQITDARLSRLAFSRRLSGHWR